MAKKCPYYYRLQDRGALARARQWLKDNPPPTDWRHSAWRWAFEHMETSA